MSWSGCGRIKTARSGRTKKYLATWKKREHKKTKMLQLIRPGG